MSQKHVSNAAGEIENGGNCDPAPPKDGETVIAEGARAVAGEVGAALSNKEPVNTGLREAAVIELEAKELSLTRQQETAIILLEAGYKRYEVAFEIGVSRSTLHRWMTKDAAFIAACNTHVNDCRETVRARLLNGLGHAADTVLRDIRTNGNLAYKMLKDAGVIKAEGGTLCVEELAAEIELAARKKKAQQQDEKNRLARTEMLGKWD